MQSEIKPKRSRKTVEEPKVAPAQASAAPSEEAAKPRRKTAVKKSSLETTPAAKQHRGTARKSTASKIDLVVSETPAVSSEVPAEVVAPEFTPVRAATADFPAKAALTHDRIALLAYAYWELRGSVYGSPEEDWFRAERDLSAELNAAG